MGLAEIDTGLRGAAIALFALLMVSFARDWRRSLTARLGTLLMLGAASYVALLAVDARFGWPLWRLPLHMASLSAPPLFWLFVSSWFDDEFELRRWHVAAVIVTVATGLVSNYLFVIGDPRVPVLGIGWRALSLIAVVLGLRASLRGRDADLIEQRRRIRLGLVGVGAVVIVWIVFAEISVTSWPPPIGFRVANAAGMAALAATVAFAILGWRDPTLAAPPPSLRPAPQRDEPDDAPLLARLDADMRHDRLYRQDGLTITAVAARLGVPEYRLRRAINQGLGARNFNAYLNGFRLSEAQDALADRTQRGVPILTIAMDAGFGSLAPFNRAFRDRHGCTPTEYRARHGG